MTKPRSPDAHALQNPLFRQRTVPNKKRQQRDEDTEGQDRESYSDDQDRESYT